MSTPPAEIRAVVSDLDGTLLQPGGILSEPARCAIRSLGEAGIPFLVATGRSLYGIRDTLTGVHDAVALGISSSGAIGYDPSSGETLWRRALEPAVVEQVVAALLRIAPGAGIAAFDGERWTVTDSYFQVRGAWPAGPLTVASGAGVVETRCCALAVADSRLESAALALGLAEAGVGAEMATVTYAGPYILDVVPPLVDKGYGVRRACQVLGVDPARVVAFGDGHNDLALFRAVGLSVAVANADPAVLAAADLIAGSNLEDGVATMLTELGLVAAEAA